MNKNHDDRHEKAEVEELVRRMREAAARHRAKKLEEKAD